MTARTLVLGSLNVDLVTRVDAAPEAGETVPGEDLTEVAGGKGANQAAAIARLGQPVAMAGHVGDDPYGVRLREGLERLGVDVSRVEAVEGAASGVAIILLDASGENRIIVMSGANGRVRPQWARAVVTDLVPADTLLMQLEIPLETVIAAAGQAREQGARIVLNAAPARPLPDRLWRLLDMIVVNEVEAALLSGTNRVDERSAATVAERLRSKGPGVAVITLGARGAVLAGPDGVIARPAPRVEVVDSTAAGDAFVGGLCAALSAGEKLTGALAFAVGAGSAACRRLGAQPSLPDLAEVRRLAGS